MAEDTDSTPVVDELALRRRIAALDEPARQLLRALVGLANDNGHVRGIAAGALATVAELPDRRQIGALAVALLGANLITYTAGSFRRAHAFRLTFVPPASWRTSLVPRMRARLRDELRRTRSARAAA